MSIRIDVEKRIVKTDKQEFPYDYLILATGSVPHTFGVPGVEDHAFFLKTLEEGVALKNHIICCFESAARRPEDAREQGILTFVIVGGGATGVEYAGALSELFMAPSSGIIGISIFVPCGSSCWKPRTASSVTCRNPYNPIPSGSFGSLGLKCV